MNQILRILSSQYITVHKHPWRSQSSCFVTDNKTDNYILFLELNKWMEELDRRYHAKMERNNTKTPSKRKVVGPEAKSQPPSSGPKWAVDASWKPPAGSGKS